MIEPLKRWLSEHPVSVLFLALGLGAVVGHMFHVHVEAGMAAGVVALFAGLLGSMTWRDSSDKPMVKRILTIAVVAVIAAIIGWSYLMYSDGD